MYSSQLNPVTEPAYARFRHWLRSGRVRALALLAILCAAVVSFLAFGQSVPPTFPAIALSSDPLFITTTGDKPGLVLSLSVEYPTVGAQYVFDNSTTTGSNTSDDAYSNTKEYLGYYDAEACYTYNNAPTETPATGQTASDYKRFDKSGAATSRKCSNAFSGNFLNWVSSSAIDMLRLSLSGGDRYIDTSSLTILQRAVIPNGNPICMWNSSNFPAKRLQKDGGGAGTFWGAVPQAMVTAAGTNDIWVANTLNGIYFKAGTAASGGCGNTGDYTLSGVAPGPSIGPIGSSSSNLPNSSISCAAENNTCTLPSGTWEVWYGAKVSGTNYWKVAPVSGSVSCSNTVFSDPISGTVKNCYYRTYSGSWTPPNAGTQLNSDGFFYSRVSVCGTDSSGNLLDVRDYGLCTRYPSGKYKPTGAVQKYSDQLRLAAFGYLLDQTDSNNGGRYGGVLRAPMKFVGQKTFDIYGVETTPSGGNPKAEWDATTGVFTANPDSDTTQSPGISGVINYLNKFGRTGTPGIYKIYDPVGELYYETLRYLQGLQPSTAAVSNLTTAMYDGFPVFTTWTDPYGDGRTASSSYACLKSNIVVIGDINTHDGNHIPTPSAAANIPDINYWTGIVGSFERNSTTNYTDGQGATRTTGNPNGANYSVPSNQIIGTAYWAHMSDIRGAGWTNQPTLQRPGLRVKTFTFDVNEYGDQNNANTRQYANQFFMAAKYGGYESDPANPGGKPFNSFGNPFKRQDGTNDNNVWQKPTQPGEANTYYLQSGARGVLSAFDEIFSRAASSSRSIAGSASQSANLTSSGSQVYQASFDTSDWSGDVVAVPLNYNATTQALTIGTTNSWSASTQLLALTSPATTRNIVVGRPGGNASPTASAFTWTAITGTTLVSDLNKPSPSAASDGRGQDRLAWLRGDRSLEGNPFRVRTKLLGDIINSSVVYSGVPTTNISSSTYASFYATNKSRTPVVFAGANDGMLHAFNATTGQADSGKEVFGFIPSWMGPKLSALTATTYLNSHQSYVDAPPVVAEAQVGSSNTATDWRTVLVGGTGAGGRGVYALDVTNPSTFSASNVMWEFTQADDVDMGFVVGQPQILKIKTSASTATTPSYKWFAVVAGGVDNYVPDSANRYSTTGSPTLFLLDLSKTAGTAWALGTNYFKISLPVDATLGLTRGPGLINFSATVNSGGDVGKIYMGDLFGNMWKIDFSQAANGTSDWNLATLSDYNRGTTAATAYPLYVAKDGSGNVQPITMAPTLVRGAVNGVTYVTFGTGKYLEVSDKTTTATNSIYAVYDSDTTIPPDGTTGPEIAGRGRLSAGSASTSTGAVTIPAFTWGHATSDADTTRRSGWYFDLPTSAERAVSKAGLVGDLLVFSSLVPGASGGANTCGASGGSGYQYQVNVDTGAGLRNVSTVGILGPTMNLNLSQTISYTAPDNTGRQVKSFQSKVITPGSTGLGDSSTITTSVAAGRLSWRQINNYQELKNNP